MFPIRDHNASGTTPYVTLTLIAVNVAVFMGSRLRLSEVGQDDFTFQSGMIPARFRLPRAHKAAEWFCEECAGTGRRKPI